MMPEIPDDNSVSDEGFFGLAKRDLDEGGETIFVVTAQPVSRARMNALALRYDEVELTNDPESPYRWFVVKIENDL